MVRQLTPYEKTHLSRFGRSGIDLSCLGEMPVEYITGQVEFMDRVFNIDKRGLIPRIETEELVELVLKRIKQARVSARPIRLAEVGTGSGVIGVSLALELQSIGQPFELYMSELSSQALDLAKTIDDQEIFIIGGGEIFKQSMEQNLIDKLYVTKVKGDFSAEIFFPPYPSFKRVEYRKSGKENSYEYEFLELVK